MMEEAIEINNIAVRHFLNREFEQAEKQYKKALKINPESATVLNNLGLLYHQKKKYKKAAEYFGKALQIEEKDTYCVNSGNAMACMNQMKSAIEWYERALKLNQNCVSAKESLAKLYEYNGNIEQAALYWKELIAYTGNTKYFLEFAKNLMKRGKFKDALKVLYEMRPESNSTAWHLVGICEYELKNYGLAIDAFRHGLAINPDREETRHYLAVTFLASGRTAEAVSEIDKVIKLNPENYRMLTEKGVILLSINRVEEAKELFETALSIQPGFKKAKKYLDMIVELIKDAEL